VPTDTIGYFHPAPFTAWVQAAGPAVLFATDDADYAVQLEALGIDTAHMQKLGLILILITPQEFDYLDGTLKDKGYSPRQHLDLS